MVTQSDGRTNPRIRAPDYDDPVYWDVKFSTGRDVGEWLNSGTTMLDAILVDLEERYPGVKGVAPRVLQLGPGISTLGTRLQGVFTSHGWLGNGIINVDFSEEAVRMGLEAEKGKDVSQAMPWVQINLLSWPEVAALSHLAPFEVILDKSTSDSIATAEIQTFSPENTAGVCPVIREIVGHNGEIELLPVEVLALHLVPLTQVGTTWAALSFSTFRFANMEYVGKYWEVVSRTPLKAPGGEVASTTHQPAIFHWLYILRRV